MSTPSSNLVIQKMADIHIVEFNDSSILDQLLVERIRSELQGLLDKSAVGKMIISFEDVTQISSAVLGILMSLDKSCKAKGGQLRLTHIGPSIKQVFTITKLDKILKIYPNVDQALVKF